MSDMRISVVIPTYNRRRLLMQTLETLTTQSLSSDRYEVVIGIDGSTDDTREALERFHPAYPLRWVYQRNGGIANATNTAARQAEHEVLLFLDDDQLASPDLLRAHLDTHERCGDVFVQGLYPLAPGYDRRGASIIYERALLRSFAPTDRTHPMSPYIWSANISVRRETWARVGGFDEDFREYGGEDTDFGMRVAALGVPFVFEPRALSFHLHEVSYGAVRRQAFSAGRSLVRLSRKHSVPLSSFSGGEMDRRIDRTVGAAWRQSPRLLDVLGHLLTAALWATDSMRIRPAQITMARLVHRYYKVGGIALEMNGHKKEAPIG
jgi:GT2 family glycosyltransferase